MRNISRVLALVVALPLLASEEQAVRAALDEWIGALARNDVAAVERLVADDYVITAGGEGKVMGKKEDLEVLHSGRVKFESAEASDVNVRVFGQTAVVTGVASFKVVGLPAVIQERFTDVYVKRKGRWQPVASHTTPIRPKSK
jgi:ketosteroid isomerase-like protein